LPDTKPRGAVLQKITGAFRRGLFMRSHEEQLRKFIHHEALNRVGLRWPPQHFGIDGAWWSANKKQQQLNRGTYHGLRLLSLHVINHLIGVALEAAADANAIRAARRFAFRHREGIYRAAVSRRALQLVDTFPVLAVALYTNDYAPWLRNIDFRKWETGRSAAADLVERGARLRDVAAAMGVPMALRHIRPGVAHLATRFFVDTLNCFAPCRTRCRVRVSGCASCRGLTTEWVPNSLNGPRGMRRKFPET
jgi:hypothetical protein